MQLNADHEIIDAMWTYGGSFASAIATAARCADHDNLQRLKDAFPELWKQYDDMATMIAKRRGA